MPVKARLSLAPALVLGSLLMLPALQALGFWRVSDVRGRVPMAAPAVASADSVPTAPWATGAGAKASGICRDSVVNGSWGIKVWIVGDTADTPTYPHWSRVIQDSIDNSAYNDDWQWIFPIGGIKSIGTIGVNPVSSDDPCVTVVGWAYTTGGGGDGAIITVRESAIDSASITGGPYAIQIRGGKDWAIFGLGMSQGMSSAPGDAVGVLNESQRHFFSNVHIFYNGDETFSRSGGVTNDTLRDLGLAYSIIGPASGSKNLGGIIGSTSNSETNEYTRTISDYMNLWTENKWRNPRIGAVDSLQIWHSIFYNSNTKIGEFAHGWMPTVRTPRVEFVGNRFKPGPYQSGTEPRTYHLEAKFDGDSILPTIYLSGNFHDSIDNGSLSLKSRGGGGAAAPGDSSMFSYESFADSAPPDSAFTTSRIVTWADHPMATRDTAGVWDTLIVQKRVGRHAVMGCAGQWIDKTSDPSFALIDSLITWIANGTGGSSHSDHDEPTDYISGGWPTMTVGTVCADSDSDGLPDSVELAITDQVSSTSVPPDSQFPSGYLAIEFSSIIGTENDYFDSTLAAVKRDCAPGTACAMAAASTTYGAPLYIYRSRSTAQDTTCYDATGVVAACPQVDTAIVRTWDGDSIPPGGTGRACWDADTVRYFVTKSALSGGNLLDSLAADTLVHPIAGCDTATIKVLGNIPGS